MIGGGQAGLATGHYLKARGRDFVILDAYDRVGQAWRDRWDTLRLFTPAHWAYLPGMKFRRTPPARDAERSWSIPVPGQAHEQCVQAWVGHHYMLAEDRAQVAFAGQFACAQP